MLLALVFAAAGALAYFVAAGSGSSSATVLSLSSPGSVAASGAGSSVNVTWNASTITGSVAASSYAVERYSGTGTDLGAASCSPVPASSGNPNAFGSFTCTDSPPVGATYKYKITARYNTAWTTTSGFTNTVTIQSVTSATAAAPAADFTNSAIAATSISSNLTGATAGATGTITFKVFGPQASAPTTCTSGGTTVGTATVSGNGTYNPSASFTPSTTGNYWWYASYNGDTYNTSASSTCGSGMAETVVTNQTTSTAAAPAAGTAGTTISTGSISSNLSGATAGATGTVTFKVFGPQASAPTTCTSGGTTVGTATVSGNGTYNPSASFTPSQAGNYWWYATYNGDVNNSGSTSTCGGTMSETVVAKASPTATAAAPAAGTAGTAISTSSISSVFAASSGANSGGTLTFKVFGPQATAPATCTSGGTTVGTATVSGNGTYNPSAAFTPTQAGNYWWYVSYNGDTDNNAANSTCGGTMAETIVAKASPSVTAAAPATDNAGTAISASSITSALSGSSGANSGGTVTFTVFGPQASAPTTCTSGGTTVGTATVSGNGTYSSSASFTPSAVGNYWWYASYNGDSNNNAANSTCGGAMAETVVSKANPSITTAAPASGTVGSAIAAGSISATLSSATSGAGGTITWKVFGPQVSAPGSCTVGGTTVGTATASGNGTYNPSAGYTPTSVGNYWWYASYAGDSDNNTANSTCGSGMTETVVNKASPTITVAAPASATHGTAISRFSISSTLAGGYSETGTITFKVFGPQASAPGTCTSGGTTVGTATAAGNTTKNPSAGYTPPSAGNYWWYVSYAGDSNNNSATSTCGAGMTKTAAS